MFTGIIEDVGSVKKVGTSTLSIRTALHDVNVGESIAVNGICLTVADLLKSSDATELTFGYSPETRLRTTIGALRAGTEVNLERALRIGDRLGGHFVTGHVESTGTLVRCETQADSSTFAFSFNEHLTRFIAPKGSIAVDGISLTVAECSHNMFMVAVIPHTLRHTNLCRMRAGQSVNLEPDVLALYVDNVLASPRARRPITNEFLKEHGFIHE